MNEIKCQVKCSDVGQYPICFNEYWKFCNILCEKSVLMSDGRNAKYSPIEHNMTEEADERCRRTT